MASAAAAAAAAARGVFASSLTSAHTQVDASTCVCRHSAQRPGVGLSPKSKARRSGDKTLHGVVHSLFWCACLQAAMVAAWTDLSLQEMKAALMQVWVL